MAASVNQDFTTYSGDDVYPIFTVYDGSGNILDISTVSDIQWYAQKDDASTPAASASKLGGTIAFVTTGVDGRFQVTLSKGVTAALSGFYIHIAKIIDALANVTTVTVGRMQVGLKPAYTYDATSIATSALYQVRRWIGDVISNDWQMTDEEILYFIAGRGTVLGAAADCAQALADQYARKPDVVSPGGMSTRYGEIAKKYSDMSAQLEAKARARGAGAMPYVGGISITDKTNVTTNNDRVQPSFNIGMTDATLPLPMPANERNANPNGGGSN